MGDDRYAPESKCLLEPPAFGTRRGNDCRGAAWRCIGEPSRNQGSADPATTVRLCYAKVAKVDHFRIEKRRGESDWLVAVERQSVSEGRSV